MGKINSTTKAAEKNAPLLSSIATGLLPKGTGYPGIANKAQEHQEDSLSY